jgi:HSF-type DNA-binding
MIFIAEFLYQLTKMLTDDNSEIIEWVDGRIKVHYPERLEAEVLHKYFRHSKFASFQRQLNYFGFRKIAGKGKMSPCSYVNESATSDIRSLLLIKRKTNGSAARKAMAQRAMALGGNLNPALGTGLPGIAGANGFGALGGAVGLSALTQQLQLQKQLGGFIDHTNSLSQLLMQNQQPHSFTDLQQLGGLKPTMPSIEQLQAQLATLTNQQNQGGASAALNAAAFNLASGGASSALGSAHFLSSENPATAALNASASGPASMPATAAMNSNSDGQINNLFDSATNLKALIGNDQLGNEAQKAAAAVGLNRLPSSTGMFPGSISNASLGNLLASSNRLSSLLSLNSFLSREPSLADLAMLPSGAAQFAAFQQQQQQQNDGQNTSST